MIPGTTAAGLPALQVSDDAVRRTVIPAWGATAAEIVDRRRGRDPTLEPSIGALDTPDTPVYHWNQYEQIPANGFLTRWLQMSFS